jgi:hypothetical protein
MDTTTAPTPSLAPRDHGDGAARQIRRVGLAGTSLLAGSTLVAVLAGWPGQLGGPGDPHAVAAESLSRGTALSPPLPLIVVFALVSWAGARRGVAGVVGCPGLALLSVVFVVGGLGEAFAPSTTEVPRAVLVTSGSVSVALAVVVLSAVWGRLRSR